MLETITGQLAEKEKSLTEDRILKQAYDNKVKKARLEKKKKDEEYL